MTLSPETTAEHVRQVFGPPETEKKLFREAILEYVRGEFYMTIEFESSTGRLLTWSAAPDD